MPYFVDSKALYFKEKTGKWYPEWVQHPNELWDYNKGIPLDVFCPGTEGEQKFTKWFKWFKEYKPDNDEYILFSNLRTIFASYNLPYLALSQSTAKEVALDVFIKMNTTAAPLSTYDIVVAQVEAQIDTSLHDLVGDIRGLTPEVESYAKPEDLVLSASAFLQDRQPNNTTFLKNGFASQMIKNWDALVKGIRRAIDFLEEERIYDSKRLPSEVVLPRNLCPLGRKHLSSVMRKAKRGHYFVSIFGVLFSLTVTNARHNRGH